MTENYFFACKLFFAIKYFRLYFFCVKIATLPPPPWKKSPPSPPSLKKVTPLFPSNPPLKVEVDMCFSSWEIVFFVMSVFRESKAVSVGPFLKNWKWNSCDILIFFSWGIIVPRLEEISRVQGQAFFQALFYNQ